MKDKAYLIFFIVGILILLLEFFVLKFDGGIGWALTSLGVIFIGIGLRNPFKVLIRLFFEYI